MLLVEGVALKSDAKVWTFFVTAKFVSKKIGIVDEMSTNDMVYPYNRGLFEVCDGGVA